MAQEGTPREAPHDESPRVNAALGIAALAVALFIVAIVVAQDGHDWLWPPAWWGPSRPSLVGALVGHGPAVEP